MLQIETGQILLRHLQDSDLSSFLAYRSNPEVCKYQGFNPFDEAKARSFIEEMKDQALGIPGEWIQLAIVDKQSQNLVGDCAIHFKADDPRLVEFGITLNPTFQSQGFAKATIELLETYLSEHFDIHKFIAGTDARNESANRLLKKLGFKEEGRLIQHFFDEESQAWQDELVFGKLRKELPS